MTIERKFPKIATKVLLYGILSLQKWEFLLKEDDKKKLHWTREQVLSVLHNLNLSETMISHVVEI